MPTKEPLRRVKRLVSRLNLPWNAVTACLRRFLLAAVLSQGFVLGEHAPFALGYIAASGSGLEGAAALLGGLVGCLLGMDTSGALRYAAAAILIYAVEFAFFDRPLYKSRWFMAVCSAVIAGITGFVYLSGAGWSQVAILNFASELVMVGVSCLFFRGLNDEDVSPDRGSLLFLTAALAVCLARFSPLAGNAGAALAVLLASRAGAGAAAVTGGAVGLAVGLTEGGTPLLAAVLAFSGALTGGPLVKQKRLGTMLLFAACGLLATAWVQGGNGTGGGGGAGGGPLLPAAGAAAPSGGPVHLPARTRALCACGSRRTPQPDPHPVPAGGAGHRLSHPLRAHPRERPPGGTAGEQCRHL